MIEEPPSNEMTIDKEENGREEEEDYILNRSFEETTLDEVDDELIGGRRDSDVHGIQEMVSFWMRNH